MLVQKLSKQHVSLPFHPYCPRGDSATGTSVLFETMDPHSELMEAAGAQCLLLGGFFETQMRRRHNIRWYSEHGAGYFSRAASRAESEPKTQLLDSMARRFEPWRQRHARLSRELRDRAFVLTRPSDPAAS